MSECEVKNKLDYILANGDDFQKNVITKCISVVHFEVSKKNEFNNRKKFSDYKNRIERVFTYGTDEQISSLIGSLLVQEHNVEMDRADSK
ncbi:MAG: hypothetical protein NPINA01_03540 [Nitrospinaceae bacterium]|nr:MAG: hypothetical protein NPINA01_03540 [Nitrospinaceae bacterium]